MDGTRDESRMRQDAEKLADIFTILQRKFFVNLSKELSRGNVSFPQYLLLGFLSQHECLTMSEIAAKMEHTTAAATGLVDRLENLGYVRRSPASEDLRKIKVCSTDTGKKVLFKVREDMVNNLVKMMGCLSDTEQESWLQIYEKIMSYCQNR
jgi:DNA-binding MarR family transcriptional regulator